MSVLYQIDVKIFLPPHLEVADPENSPFFPNLRQWRRDMRGAKLSARPTKNSVETAPPANTELIFGFRDLIIGGGGY